MDTISYTLSLFNPPGTTVWHVRASVHNPMRRQFTKSLKTQDEIEAKEKLDRLNSGGADAWLQMKLKEVMGLESFVPRETTSTADSLDDLIAWYINTRLVVLGRKPKTVGNYQRLLNDFRIYCTTKNVGRLQQLSSRIIEDWKAWHIRVKERAANRHEIMMLRQFITDAAEINDFDIPRIKWDIPKKGLKSKYKALTVQQLEDFLVSFKQFEPECYDIVAWAALTGWRVGDIWDLRWSEVDLIERCIDRDQIKTSNKLSWPISKELGDILSRQDRVGQFVFTTPQYTRCQKRLARFCEKHWTRNVSFRDLRKSFGTILANNGLAPHLLRELMGHKSLEMTLQYYVEADLHGMREGLLKSWPVKV